MISYWLYIVCCTTILFFVMWIRALLRIRKVNEINNLLEDQLTLMNINDVLMQARMKKQSDNILILLAKNQELRKKLENGDKGTG